MLMDTVLNKNSVSLVLMKFPLTDFFVSLGVSKEDHSDAMTVLLSDELGRPDLRPRHHIVDLHLVQLADERFLVERDVVFFRRKFALLLVWGHRGHRAQDLSFFPSIELSE